MVFIYFPQAIFHLRVLHIFDFVSDNKGSFQIWSFSLTNEI